jgi:hypothetical protein
MNVVDTREHHTHTHTQENTTHTHREREREREGGGGRESAEHHADNNTSVALRCRQPYELARALGGGVERIAAGERHHLEAYQ